MNNTLSKKEIILYSAIDEFAEKGYQNASTNSISKRANVSKGLIFHHFKDKSNLFHECIIRAFDEYKSKINLEDLFKEKDIFRRLILLEKEKSEFSNTL